VIHVSELVRTVTMFAEDETEIGGLLSTVVIMISNQRDTVASARRRYHAVINISLAGKIPLDY
jgi:hypothetical protein